MTVPPQSSAPLLHRFLGIGQVLLAAVFLGLTYTGVAPLIPPEDETGAIMGYMFAGLTVVLVAVALLVLKPRAPVRRSGQSVEQFWTSPEIIAKIMPVWFVLEGAGVLSAVGFLMTGHLAVGLTMGAAIVTFWMNGPDAFENV